MNLNAPNKHGALLIFEDGTRCFVDGIPDACEHDWNGSSYYISASGKFIDWKTYPLYRSFTDRMRSWFIHLNHYEIEDPIVQSGVTCSKCSKPYEPPMF